MVSVMCCFRLSRDILQGQGKYFAYNSVSVQFLWEYLIYVKVVCNGNAEIEVRDTCLKQCISGTVQINDNLLVSHPDILSGTNFLIYLLSGTYFFSHMNNFAKVGWVFVMFSGSKTDDQKSVRTDDQNRLGISKTINFWWIWRNLCLDFRFFHFFLVLVFGSNGRVVFKYLPMSVVATVELHQYLWKLW